MPDFIAWNPDWISCNGRANPQGTNEQTAKRGHRLTANIGEKKDNLRLAERSRVDKITVTETAIRWSDRRLVYRNVGSTGCSSKGT